jgi:MarR family transcriptional regulator for hemolysin
MSNDQTKKPQTEPIGLQVQRTAKALNRAFDEALAEQGGSLPTWLILLSLKARKWGTQRELAAAVGIEGATLTHHLDGLERAGLITRKRDPENRRVQRVELTGKGDDAFFRLRRAAMRFDQRLRAGLGEEELETVRSALRRLHENVSDRGST